MSSKVTGDEPKKIVATLLLMLGDIFDYVESKPEMYRSLKFLDQYYQRIKISLKSESVNEAIEKNSYFIEKQITVCCSL